MHDLNLFREGQLVGACEVTAAADTESIELWNLMHGTDDRWIEPDLLGGWMVAVTPRSKAKRLKNELPAVLRQLERSSSGRNLQADQHLTSLRVTHASRGDTAFPGSIYVTIERSPHQTGGIVSVTGNGLTRWFNEWIQEPGQAHNVAKLLAAKAPERHLFVILPGFTTAPFSASELLMRSNAPLPTEAPTLPAGITHVWLMSTWDSGDVFHWSPNGWRRFQKVPAIQAP